MIAASRSAGRFMGSSGSPSPTLRRYPRVVGPSPSSRQLLWRDGLQAAALEIDEL